MEGKLDGRRNRLWRLFLTAHLRLMAVIEAELAAAGLPPLEWYDVLWALTQAAGGRLRLSELAEALLTTRSTLTRLVDRLEAAGLVRREAAPEDRRGAFAVLTEAGAALQAQIWPVYARSIAEHFGCHLDEAEVANWTAAFERIVEVAAREKSQTKL